MGIVHIDQIKPESVLAEELRDINGRLLLAKGQKILRKHIRILKIWGITEIDVVGEDGGEAAEEDADQAGIEEIEERTRDLFRHADMSHPAMAELFRLSVWHQRERKSSGPLLMKDHVEESGDHGTEIDVRDKINVHSMKLPEIPAIVFELNDAISDPSSSAANVAQVVSKSPSLSARLLQIANSSFYGFPSKIDSISRAVTLIGNREISSLALGVSALTIFQDISKNLIDMRQILKHSFACGIISRIFAAQKNIPQTEQLFVSGLLHDIGRLVVYRYFPGHAKRLWRQSTESGKLLIQEEPSCLGCRHTDIGKFLLRKWKLPPALENNVAYHHRPSMAPNPVHAGIVHVADILVNGMGIGTSGERHVPPLDEKVWDDLGISPKSFGMTIRQALHQLYALEKILKD